MPPHRQQQSARLARYNRAVVLDLIRRLAPVSKSELADRSGLAVSSVLNILGSLERRGLVRETGIGPSTGGRRPILVELNPEAHYSVGVNIRITAVEAVLLDLVGTVVAETALPFQGGKTPRAVTETVVEAVDQVIRLAAIDPGIVLGVGVGCPGPVSHGRIVPGAPALTDWINVPLADQLEEKLGLPVTLENDANVGALAEYRHGAGTHDGHAQSLVYIFADHGIGEGIILDGKLYRGADGLAGELGHVVIDVHGRKCVCGQYGCLEALASVGSVIQRAIVAGKLRGDTQLGEKFSDDWEAVSFATISEAVANGDPVAIAALDEAISYLALGISNVVRQLRPEVIVMGGQLFDQAPRTVERLQAAINARPSFFGVGGTEIVIGDLATKAPTIGAAILILEDFFGIPHHAMSSDRALEATAPGFEDIPVWPDGAEAGVVLKRSNVKILSAGKLEPRFARVAVGEPVNVTVEVELEGDADMQANQVKALLHWDRVALFGASWPNPKNSPMRLLSIDGSKAVFGLTLGSLPPGKYEFAVHILAANDLWVPADGGRREANGRIEVLSSRSVETQDKGEEEESLPA